MKQIECGMKTFDSDVNSIVKGIREEGQKMKIMIDRIVQTMIHDINSKTKQEREKLQKMIKEAQTRLTDITLLDQRRTETEKTRRDAVLYKKKNRIL